MAYGQNGFLLAWSYKPLAISHQLLKIAIGRPSGLIRYLHSWIPDDLPQMTVGILEIPGVASPKRILGRLDNRGPRSSRLLHHRVDFFFAADIVADGELGRAVSGFVEGRVMSDIISGPQG